MRAYVETNFLREIVLLQEQHRSCEEIVSLCGSGSIPLTLPAFCIPEAYFSLVGKRKRTERFARDFEKLNVCHRALKLPPHATSDLDERLAHLAMNDGHPLIRAKALLGWGRHARAADFGAADKFLAGCRPEWRVYALTAIQGKTRAARDERYREWAGEGSGLGGVAAMLKSEPIAWTKL